MANASTDEREAFGHDNVPVDPYPPSPRLHADREGYPFAWSQAELLRRHQSMTPGQAELDAEYGPRTR